MTKPCCEDSSNCTNIKSEEIEYSYYNFFFSFFTRQDKTRDSHFSLVSFCPKITKIKSWPSTIITYSWNIVVSGLSTKFYLYVLCNLTKNVWQHNNNKWEPKLIIAIRHRYRYRSPIMSFSFLEFLFWRLQLAGRTRLWLNFLCSIILLYYICLWCCHYSLVTYFSVIMWPYVPIFCVGQSFLLSIF